MRTYNISEENKEKRRLAKEERLLQLALVKEEKLKQVKFTLDYIQKHTYISSKNVAKLYHNCGRQEYPHRSTVANIGKILRDFKNKGLIFRYNNSQYKKVG